MDTFFSVLSDIGTFFNAFGTVNDYAASSWFFAEYVTGFIGFLVDLGSRIAELFA
jgi:hypothetical protein